MICYGESHKCNHNMVLQKCKNWFKKHVFLFIYGQKSVSIIETNYFHDFEKKIGEKNLKKIVWTYYPYTPFAITHLDQKVNFPNYERNFNFFPGIFWFYFVH